MSFDAVSYIMGKTAGEKGNISVESLSVTANGQYSAPSGKAYSPVTVDVQPELEPLSVTENGTYMPGTDVDGFSSVSVSVPQGGGGGVSYYTPTPNNSVVSSLVGLIVRSGSRASFCGRVQYASAVTANNRLVMTVPDEIKPAGHYIFTTGNGAKTSHGTGFIGPDGKVYVNTIAARTYDNFEVSWDIPTSLVDIGSSSIVTNTRGKICIAGGYASISVLIEANPSDTGWQSGVLVIPDSVKPTSPIGVFSNYGSIGSAMKDCNYVATTGGIDIFLPSGAQTLLVQAAWVVGT